MKTNVWLLSQEVAKESTTFVLTKGRGNAGLDIMRRINIKNGLPESYALKQLKYEFKTEASKLMGICRNKRELINRSDAHISTEKNAIKDNNNRCYYCTEIIPEGRQVCPSCEKTQGGEII